MGVLLYGLVRLIEATFIYLLAFAIARQLKSPIPPIGSTAYVLFLVLWPAVIRPVLGPGLQTIPIIGDILSLLDLVARSGLQRGPRDQEGGHDSNKNTTSQPLSEEGLSSLEAEIRRLLAEGNRMRAIGECRVQLNCQFDPALEIVRLIETLPSGTDGIRGAMEKAQAR